MTRVIILLMGTLFLLAACGGTATPPQESLKVEDIQLPDTYDEFQAQVDYKKACAVCHGNDLQGAPAYPRPITGMSKEEVYIAIIEGVRMMPGNLVTGEDAENLAVWIAAQ